MLNCKRVLGSPLHNDGPEEKAYHQIISSSGSTKPIYNYQCYWGCRDSIGVDCVAPCATGNRSHHWEVADCPNEVLLADWLLSSRPQKDGGLIQFFSSLKNMNIWARVKIG